MVAAKPLILTADQRAKVLLMLDVRLPARQPGDCWLVDHRRGEYVRVGIVGRTVSLHRLVYAALVGDPGTAVLDHAVCDEKACCNPAHLEPKTNRANILRGTAPTAVNARKTECIRGHPFDEANTYWCTNPDGSVRRICRACNSALTLRRYHERRGRP